MLAGSTLESSTDGRWHFSDNWQWRLSRDINVCDTADVQAVIWRCCWHCDRRTKACRYCAGKILQCIVSPSLPCRMLGTCRWNWLLHRDLCQLCSFTAKLIQVRVMQRRLITVNVHKFLLCLCRLICNVFRMSTISTFACFESCPPLVNGGIHCTLFSAVCVYLNSWKIW